MRPTHHEVVCGAGIRSDATEVHKKVGAVARMRTHDVWSRYAHAIEKMKKEGKRIQCILNRWILRTVDLRVLMYVFKLKAIYKVLNEGSHEKQIL